MTSLVQQTEFGGLALHIKRDDLFFALDAELGLYGNKARKLQYFLKAELPEIFRIVSYGSAQSNMLFSLSCLARLRGWQLDFYTDHIADDLFNNPRGNYAAALANGAQIHKVREPAGANQQSVGEYVEATKVGDAATLYIPEGGHSAFAELGLKGLADEINSWVMENDILNPKVMLPSGTGTSALYLQKHLPFEVLTCACVGSADYLRQQFFELSEEVKHHPTILLPPADSEGNAKKYHFGKCYPEFYAIWQELEQETGIRFELLYDPLGWICLMEYVRQRSEQAEAVDENLIYIHQGGMLGNESMLSRYQRKISATSEPKPN